MIFEQTQNIWTDEPGLAAPATAIRRFFFSLARRGAKWREPILKTAKRQLLGSQVCVSLSQSRKRIADREKTERRMRKVTVKASAPTRISKPPLSASESAAVFGPFPLVAGEAAADYETLYNRVSAAVEPADFLEEMFVRDIVDLTCDIFRLRRVKADYLSEHMQDELVDRLKGRLDYLAARELIADWAKGDAGAIRAVDATLAERGLSVSSITARTFAERFDVLDRFNQFLANAEARRNNALHEIQRHRLFLAEQLRRVVEEIDAQPAEVEALSQQKSQAAE
jgi:hypothetical protein